MRTKQTQDNDAWPEFQRNRTVHLHLQDQSDPACGCRNAASSPPQKAKQLFTSLLQALPSLRTEGYNALRLTGGEPLFYPMLPKLIEAAKAEGFETVLVTDGLHVTLRYQAIIKAIDRIVIPYAGMSALHNRIRGNACAWGVAKKALAYLAEIGKPASVTYTVTRASLASVPDFVKHCASLSVHDVQLCPLASAGHTPVEMADLALRKGDLARLGLMVQTLQRAWGGEVMVHANLTQAKALTADTELWKTAVTDGAGQRLSNLVNPLVITSDEVLRPYTFDFPEEFDLGRLQDLAPDRRVWITCGLPRLCRLLAKTLDAAAHEDGFLDRFAFLRDQALKSAALVT